MKRAPTTSITETADTNKVKLNIPRMASQSEWDTCGWRSGLLNFNDNKHQKKSGFANHDAYLPVISGVILLISYCIMLMLHKILNEFKRKRKKSSYEGMFLSFSVPPWICSVYWIVDSTYPNIVLLLCEWNYVNKKITTTFSAMAKGNISTHMKTV